MENETTEQEIPDRRSEMRSWMEERNELDRKVRHGLNDTMRRFYQDVHDGDLVEVKLAHQNNYSRRKALAGYVFYRASKKAKCMELGPEAFFSTEKPLLITDGQWFECEGSLWSVWDYEVLKKR